jgi:hypothetical protein
MAKDSLFCNYWSYIASGTGSQAEQTFGVLEKLANDSIDTFSGSTGKIFKDEVVINNASEMVLVTTLMVLILRHITEV